MSYEEPFISCYLFGALRYFANIEDSICLIHGPSSCSFFCRNSVLVLNGYKDSIDIRTPKIYCTCFNDDDVVFGGQKKLENAIIDIYNKYKPKLLFVLNCCVTEIIGENVQDVTNLLSEKLGCKIIAINSAGFKGDHKLGMIKASSLLIEKISKSDVVKKEKSINILGEFNIDRNTTKELIEYLVQGNIDINIVFPGTSTIQEIEEIGQASLNFVVCNNASKHVATILKNKFDIDPIYNSYGFFGIENSLNILNQIFDSLNIKEKPYIEKYKEVCNKFAKLKEKFEKKTAIIISGNRRALGYALLLSELGIEIKCIFTEQPIESFEKQNYLDFTNKVLIEENSDDLRKVIEEEKPDYVFSTFGEIVYPYKTIFRPKDDFAGFDGAIRFAEYLLNYEGDAK